MASRLEHVLELSIGSFQFSSTLFLFSKGGAAVLEVPVRNILWVEEGEGGAVQVSALVKKGKRHSLRQLDGVATKPAAVAEWATTLLVTAYDGVKPSRRLRVLVNPVGGPGKAVRTYERIVMPVFEAAHCLLDTTYTEYRGHMTSIVKDLDFKYDAIVVLSGDGGVHEVLNGLAQRPDGRKALTIPITQIPTGSANALCVNVLGPEDAFDVHLACLNVIKGRPMQIDMCSVSQGDKRVFSTLTQALGLMADLDLGTEHLRWMGDARFTYGFLRGVATLNVTPIEVELKIANDDKHHLVKMSSSNANVSHHVEPVDIDNWDHEHHLPPLLHTGPEHRGKTEGWTKYDGDILYVYAGSMPYVARDLMQFPVIEAADGTLDIVVQNLTARKTMLEAIFKAPKGLQYWIPSQKYYRVKAYRVKMLATDGNLSIDGEPYPFESYEVEAHPGLARTLSLTGRFFVDKAFYQSQIDP